MSELRVRDMTVTWRHALDVGALGLTEFQGRRELERRLEDAGAIVAPDPVFEQQRKVSYRVCSLVAHKALILQLPGLELACVDGAEDRSNADLAALTDLAWTPLRISLLLHQSGVALIKYTARFEESLSTPDAVARIRLGLQALLLRGPARYANEQLGERERQWVRTIGEDGDQVTWCAGLRDFSAHVLRHYLQTQLGPQLETPFGAPRTTKVYSTTLIEIDQTEPRCEALNDFVAIERHGRALRGVATMDQAYPTRADQLVAESFAEDLSQDEELGLFLLGLSDLVLYTTRADEAWPHERERLGLADDYVAARYIAGHYACLLEWLYVERYLIEMYDRLLSRSMTRDLMPEEMLRLQRSSIQDLLEYGEGITPYATRAAIRERAREVLRLPEEQERLEKKRDVVADYVMQKYSLRTNRGIGLLNIIVSATVAFELVQLVMAIAESRRPAVWSLVSALLFGALLLGFVHFYRSLEQQR